MQLDDPIATMLPMAMGISWPFDSWVKYILSHARLLRGINCSFPLTFIIRGDACPVVGFNWTQLTISLAKLSPHGPLHTGSLDMDEGEGIRGSGPLGDLRGGGEDV